MLYLSDVRDWLKSFGNAEHYYIGKLDNKKDKSIGVYQNNARAPTRAIGQESTYEVKQISVLVHWNKNAKETEQTAFELYEKLRAVSSCDLGSTHVYFITLNHAEPIDVGTDDNGVYERVIEFNLYYEKGFD